MFWRIRSNVNCSCIPQHEMFRSISRHSQARCVGAAAVIEVKPRFRGSELDIEYEVFNVIYWNSFTLKLLVDCEQAAVLRGGASNSLAVTPAKA